MIGAVGAESGADLFRFDLATKEITPLVTTPFLDEDPALSPDDRLLAYASEQSGRWELYVQALGGGRGTWQISSEGGRFALAGVPTAASSSSSPGQTG